LRFLLLLLKGIDSGKLEIWKHDPLSALPVAAVGDGNCQFRWFPKLCPIAPVVFVCYYVRALLLSSIHRKHLYREVLGCEIAHRSVSGCVRLGEENEAFLE
jgi:hypothetical protein